MSKLHPQVMRDMSEVVAYDKVGIPLYIREDKLTLTGGKHILPHWHEDLELFYVKSGHTRYQINSDSLILEAGDCLLINARQMHYNECILDQEVHFICVLGHPKLLAATPEIYNQYVRPLLRNPRFTHLHWKRTAPSTATIAKLMEEICSCGRYTGTYQPIKATGLLYQIWQLVLDDVKIHDNRRPADSDRSIQKAMISYIYQHYRENIKLADIAAAGHVCRNRCCQLFKQYMHESPIDFVNSYRLAVSCQQLKNSNASITEIAMTCGFSHTSYYTKLFRRKYSCTPSEYRKSCQLTTF